MPQAQAHPRRRSSWGGVILLWSLAVVALLIHFGAGSADAGKPFLIRVMPWEVVGHLFEGPLGASDPGIVQERLTNNTIVWQIRMPRGLACFFVGAILGIVGSAFQALFRNPLAEPYIVGVSSGAAVGGALALVLGFAGWAAGFGLIVCAFLGGGASLLLVLGLAGRRGRTDVQVLLLSGVVIGALLSSVLSMILFAAGFDANQLLRWLLGSASFIAWNKVWLLFGALIVGTVVLAPQGKKLNALALSEETAQRLGVDTGRLKGILLVTGTAMTAVAVGSVGVIGFLGLVAPHISRQVVGIDWRSSLLGAGGVGAGILVFADILAQRLVPGAELPVGVITAILGAPFLLVLMRRSEA